MAAFGEAISYGYLIEDFLRLHLFECSHFHLNGYNGHSKANIRDMKFVQLVREFGYVYPNQGKLGDGFDKIRLIRNKLVHALVDEFGSDVESEEGRDQIHALLVRTIRHGHEHLKALRRIHETAVRHAIENQPEAVLSRDEEFFEARVSTSEIQSLLDDLDELAKT
jgi:hypothetical protein